MFIKTVFLEIYWAKQLKRGLGCIYSTEKKVGVLSWYKFEVPLAMFLAELTIGRQKLRLTANILIKPCFSNVLNDQMV